MNRASHGTIEDAVVLRAAALASRRRSTALRTRQVVEHDYECSSATTLRLFRMRVMPREGRVVLHEPERRVTPSRYASALFNSASSELHAFSAESAL